MIGIIEFLRARYAEEAKRWQIIWRFEQGDKRIDGWWELGGTFGHAVADIIDTTHGGRDLAAKRRMLDLVISMVEDGTEQLRTAADMLARNLAAPYIEHPDYNPTWRLT